MRLTRSTVVSILVGLLVATVVGIAATATGAAVATSGRAAGPVKACASKADGGLRLLTGKSCRKRERKVVWARQGERGPRGANGVSGYQIVADSVDTSGSAGYFNELSLTCPAGKMAVGGGAFPVGPGGTEVGVGSFLVRNSGPSPDGSAWTLTVDLSNNGGGFVSAINYRAVCVTATG